MKYYVQTKIIRNSVTVSNSLRQYTTAGQLNCTQLKTLIKNAHPIISLYTINEEIMYIGNTEMGDDDLIPFKSGIELDLLID